MAIQSEELMSKVLNPKPEYADELLANLGLASLPSRDEVHGWRRAFDQAVSVPMYPSVLAKNIVAVHLDIFCVSFRCV